MAPAGALLDVLTAPAAWLDVDRRIVAVNTAWSSSVIPSAGPRFGEGASYVFDDLPGLAPADVAGIQRALSTASHQPGTSEVEYPARANEASSWIRTRVVSTATPREIFVVHEDITALRRTEAALRRSRASVRAVVAGAPVTLFSLDHDGVFTLVEGAQSSTVGFADPSHVGRSILETHPDDALGTTVREAAAGRPGTAVCWRRGQAYEVRCSPAGPEVDHAIAGIATDVTDRERARRMKDEFLAMVNHELRTPLTSVAYALRMLEDREDEDGRALVRVAHANVGRISRLIEDMLDLDRLEYGRMSLRREEVDPSELAQAATGEMEPLAIEAGVTLHVAAGDAPAVSVDRDRLLQVLTNLLANAIRHSPRREAVTVQVAADRPGAVRWSVADRGPGLAPEQVASAFGRFGQVAPSGARGEGLGLGLAIASGLVEAHGGRLEVESTPGEGATFHVVIPVSRPGRRQRGAFPVLEQG